MNSALERLRAERTKFKKERNFLYFANPMIVNDVPDLMTWRCFFPGPNIELYKDSFYEVELKFKNNYPFKPPSVFFVRDVFHPNVYTDKRVCLDIISVHWKPTMTVTTILKGLQQLLATPNINSPAHSAALHAYKAGKAVYEEKVRNNIMKNHRMPDWSSFSPKK